MSISFVHKPKIFITGCSWAHGEWGEGNEQYTVIHEGLIHYFREDGYNVLFSGKGGSGNLESCQRLTNQLEQYYEKNDLILFIQTDPIRDLNESLTDQLVQTQSYVKLGEQLLENFYYKINSVGQQFDSVINLIGGLYDLLPLQKLKNYYHIRPLVESWINLLVPNQVQIGISDNSYTVRDIDFSKLDKDISHKIVDEMYKLDYNRNVWKNDYYFKPDNKHPNRKAHKILYHVVKEKLEL